MGKLHRDTVGKADRSQISTTHRNLYSTASVGDLLIELSVNNDYIDVKCITPDTVPKLCEHMASLMTQAVNDEEVYKALRTSHEVISKILEFVEMCKGKEASDE